jgi:hypothetical protein
MTERYDDRALYYMARAVYAQGQKGNEERVVYDELL